jgi:hypothetical protein
MPENISCPECGRALRLPREVLGSPVRCPACTLTFTARLGVWPPRREEDWDEDEDDFQDRPYRRRFGRSLRRDCEPHRGSLILTLGILSLVICGWIGPFAWILGQRDLQRMRTGEMDPEGEGTTNAGRICGIIGTVLGVLQLCWIGFIAFAILNDLDVM